MTPKPLQLIQYAWAHDCNLTTAEVHQLLAGDYYRNGKKYCNDIVARMVKRGILKRVKRGTFRLVVWPTGVPQPHNPNQLQLDLINHETNKIHLPTAEHIATGNNRSAGN